MLLVQVHCIDAGPRSEPQVLAGAEERRNAEHARHKADSDCALRWDCSWHAAGQRCIQVWQVVARQGAQ